MTEQNKPENDDDKKADKKRRGLLSRLFSVTGFLLMPVSISAVKSQLTMPWKELGQAADQLNIDFSFKGVAGQVRQGIETAYKGIYMPKNRQEAAVVLTNTAALLLFGVLIVYVAASASYYATWFITEAYAQGILKNDKLGQLKTDELTQTVWQSFINMKSQATAMGAMLGIVNLLLLVIFAVIFLLKWPVIAVEGASDGKIKASKFWLIRAIIGLVMVFPVLAYGINGGQAILLNVSQWSGSFASLGWKLFAEQTIVDGQPVSTPVLANKFESVVSNLLLAETCMLLSNIIAERNGDDPYVEYNPPKRLGSFGIYSGVDGSGQARGSGELMASFDGTKWSIPDGVCGTIALEFEESGYQAAIAATNAHVDAFSAVLEPIGQVAEQLAPYFLPGTPEYGTSLPDVNETLSAARIYETYQETLTTKLAESESIANDEAKELISKQLQQDGWMYSGAYVLRLSLVSQSYNAAYSSFPDISGPQEEAFEISEIVSAGIGGVRTWLEKSDYALIPGAKSPNGIGVTDVEDLLTGGANFNSLFVFNMFKPDTSTNPIGELMNYGHGVISTVTWGLTTLAGIAGAAGITSATPVAGGAAGAFMAIMQVVGPIMQMLIGLLLLAGVTLAFIIPFIPYSNFVIGIVLWMQNGLIAMVAVGLAAISMLDHRDERAFTPAMVAAGTGILRFLAMPILMVAGLVFGLVIANAVLNLNNKMFQELIYSTTVGTGLISQVAWTVLFTMLSYTIVNVSFKLIIGMSKEVFEFVSFATRGMMDGRDATGNPAGSIGNRINGNGPRLNNAGQQAPGGKVNP